MNVKDAINKLLMAYSYEDIACMCNCSRRTIERARQGLNIREVYAEKIRQIAK